MAEVLSNCTTSKSLPKLYNEEKNLKTIYISGENVKIKREIQETKFI